MALLTLTLFATGCSKATNEPTVNTNSTNTSNTTTNSAPANNAETNTSGRMKAVIMQNNEEFTLFVGQTAMYEANSTAVTLNTVSNDSRCPEDAQCITAGSVTVEIATTDYAGIEDTAELKLPENDTVDLGGDGGVSYELQLVDVAPQSKSGESVNAEEYSATFKLIVNE